MTTRILIAGLLIALLAVSLATLKAEKHCTTNTPAPDPFDSSPSPYPTSSHTGCSWTITWRH